MPAASGGTEEGLSLTEALDDSVCSRCDIRRLGKYRKTGGGFEKRHLPNSIFLCLDHNELIANERPGI